jgi:hypothetical protein
MTQAHTVTQLSIRIRCRYGCWLLPSPGIQVQLYTRLQSYYIAYQQMGSVNLDPCGGVRLVRLKRRNQDRTLLFNTITPLANLSASLII